MSVYEKLKKIQAELKAPKNQYNSFGKYNYRSCEDILEGLKPLLVKNQATLTISDEIVLIGDRYYVKATAKLIDIEKGESIESSAFAREDETKKGMDLAQVTGSTSSYARKYALNGLFAIDDTKDSDATNTHEDKPNNESKPTATKGISEAQIKRLFAIAKKHNIDAEGVKKGVMKYYNKMNVADLTKQEYDELISRIEKGVS